METDEEWRGGRARSGCWRFIIILHDYPRGQELITLFALMFVRWVRSPRVIVCVKGRRGITRVSVAARGPWY